MPKELINGIHGTFTIDPHKERKLYKQMKEYGAHQRNELAMLLSFIKEKDVVVDAGAHIGTFAIPFSKKIGPEGKVYAFEPTPETHKTLVKNIEINGAKNILPIQQVLGSSIEKLQAHIPTYEYGGISFSKISEGKDVSFTSISLDEFWERLPQTPKIDVLKIDVEGMEYDVFVGAKKILQRDLPILYFEVNTRQTKDFIKTAWKTERFLKSIGYTFFKNLGERNSNNDTYRLGHIPSLILGGRFGDILAIPRSHPRFPKHFSGRIITSLIIIKRKIHNFFK